MSATGDSMAIGIMSGQETVVLEMSTPFSGGVATAMTLRARQVLPGTEFVARGSAEESQFSAHDR